MSFRNKFWLLIVLVVFSVSCNSTEESEDSTPSDGVDSTTSGVQADDPSLVYGYQEDSVYVVHGMIKQNQSLGEILSEYHVPSSKLFQVANNAKGIFDIRKLRANKEYTLICSQDSSHTAKCFVYHPDKVDYVEYHFDDTLAVVVGHKEVEIVEQEIAGTITSSLYKSIVGQGGSPLLANNLADVYAWQIDFFGIQEDDSYKVVYEQKRVEGEVVGLGKILAADFQHAESHYEAFLFTQDSVEQYFDAGGNSLRKAFLKAPLSFSRISSHFSNSRLHPILKIRRPHHGVDYAAPSGTPVQSIGDGVVTKANYSGGAGNMIKVKHNSVYTTAYLHLKGFSSGLKVGAHVNQGEVIGYVGSTGLSTGPHLDFRVWKNGTAVDPLKLDPPSVEPIDSLHIESFNKLVKQRKGDLERIAATSNTVAAN